MEANNFRNWHRLRGSWYRDVPGWARQKADGEALRQVWPVSSAKIASRFADATAIGFMCGKRSGVTVLDIDTKDEGILADAVNRHGKTPIIAAAAGISKLGIAMLASGD